MKASKIPPHIIIDLTKEVIFYISKNSDKSKDIAAWMQELNLNDYNGMIINSKCMFNRLKDQDCK
tara:strand:+ start:277 stop:471 length:195 start_codon:yes stop_codon:yes gene_type:complete